MLRLWLCLLLVLFSPAVGGALAAPAGAEVCTQHCADDDERGQCAPDCTDCACCSHVRPAALTASPGLVWQEPEDPRLEWTPARLTSADPGEILHVPIAPLA